jgi:type II secretory pathway predicted ATPase ExeA
MNNVNLSRATHDLAVSLKTLWGANAWPFGAASANLYEPAFWKKTFDGLEQLVSVKTSGILTGPNGVGKSRMIQALIERLPEKNYRPILLTHATLSSGDISRYLCRSQGLPAAQRRSDNVLALRQYWRQLQPVWPVVIYEEAQNLSTLALEELRLLTCDRNDTQPPFSLVLTGDDSLLPRLQMGVNRPLLSRLGFGLEISPWPPEELIAYIAERLREVGIHDSVLEPQTQNMLIQLAGGLPRALNHLAQRAFEEAAAQNSRLVKPTHLQSALARIPWLKAADGRLQGG